MHILDAKKFKKMFTIISTNMYNYEQYWVVLLKFQIYYYFNNLININQ